MATPTTSHPGLLRVMGRWSLAALVLNSIIGSGIFGLPSIIAKEVGWGSVWAYLLAATGMGFIMLCFAEVSSRFTAAGGPYLYAREAFGTFAGIEMAWLVYLARLSAGAGNANVFILYLGEFWPAATSPVPRALILALLFGILAAINYRGVKSGAWLSNFFTASKLIPLIVLIVAGLLYLAVSHHPVAAQPPVSATPGDWITAILLLVYAYGGFEGAVIATGEARDPRRDTPFALLAALAACTILFTLVQAVVMATLPSAAGSERPLASAARQVMGSPGAMLLTVGALLSVYGLLSAMMLYVPRLTFALAEYGDFPPVFGAVHRRFRTPHISIITFAVLVWVLATLGSFRWNAMLSAVSRLFAYGAVCAALPALRRKHPAGARFSVPAGTLFACLGVGFSLVLVSRMGRGDLAIVLVTAAVALMNWMWARRKNEAKRLSAGS